MSEMQVVPEENDKNSADEKEDDDEYDLEREQVSTRELKRKGDTEE